ncbi:Serine/threonine-protein kinase mig-15 [Sarcoptes scabiei]|nr:Serine/threonine-protein kinase mig-15 [Sarcoptes scabiei]
MKLLKRIRRIAAQKVNQTSQATNNLAPLAFNLIRGENIRLSSNNTVAERVHSYCKGICFSQRPVCFNERITIRIVDMSHFWSGVLRFGFTSRDPATLSRPLPKYACPNLTNCGHTFAKALPERYAHKNCLLSFYLSQNGNIHYSINNVDKGIILSNVNINGSFWAVIDLYGNSSKIEIIDSRHSINNRSFNNLNEQSRLHSSISMFDLPNEVSHEPSPQIYSGEYLEPFQFHRTRGCNVRLSSNKCVAERNRNYYSNGYVFTQRPLAIGEKIVLQILQTDEMFTGSLAFGLTSCHPNQLNVIDLPEDSHHLLDRSEYWTVIKDVANSPMAGDEIAFSITESGEVIMIKNRQRPITLMHVDVSQHLWAFFDIYGSTLKVRMLGSQRIENNRTKSTNHRTLSNTHSISMHNVYKAFSKNTIESSNYSTASKSNRNLQKLSYSSMYKTISNENKANATKKASYQYNTMGDINVTQSNLYSTINQNKKIHSPSSVSSTHSNSSFGNECVVCYDEPINSVFYTCGHVCMCFKCSVKQWQTSGHCPICRARIVDVIRTYWS